MTGLCAVNFYKSFVFYLLFLSDGAFRITDPHERALGLALVGDTCGRRLARVKPERWATRGGTPARAGGPNGRFWLKRVSWRV